MPTHAKKSRPGGSNQLRSQLLALGAEQMYRQLTRQLDALRRAYPALNKFDAVPAGSNGHSNPAPEALQLFRARGQKKSTPGARTQRRPESKPVVPGTLVANIVQTLQKKGPLTAVALASELHTSGRWKPKTAKTDKKRRAAINVILRGLVQDNRQLIRVVSGGSSTHDPHVYGAV